MAEVLDLRLSVLADLAEKRRQLVADLAWIDGMIFAAGGNPGDFGMNPETSHASPTVTSTAALPPVPAATAPARQRTSKKRKSGQGRYGRSVRQMVVEIVESNPRWWSTRDVMEQLKAVIGPDLVDARLGDNMRSALYTAKTEGQFEHDPERGYRAATGSTPTNTETPVSAGGSGPATTNGLGGEAHAQTFASDHSHDPSRRNGHHLDPSVAP